ncbi:MAG: adenosylcobinamide-GDP ribazoletransferase [Alphaproteobacteria bacterium]
MKGLFAALQFLSAARRYRKTAMQPAEIASGILYFPLVGLGLGLILVGLNYLLERYLESEILSTVHVMMLIILTGAVHLEELQKSFDRLSERSPIGRGPESPMGIYGLLAILLVVLFKIRAIEVIGETRSLTLLIAPTLARWAPLMLVYGGSAESNSARIGEGLRNWQFVIITALTLAAAGYFLGIAGLWVGLCLSLLALFTRLYVTRQSGGFAQDDLGALIELGESLSFVLFASF